MDYDNFISKYSSRKNEIQGNIQDVNATAIDSMLVNIRVIFKKIIQFRKYYKETQQIINNINNINPLLITQQQIQQKILNIELQSKNLTLHLPNHIPPDKRMTSLFYMRICKEIQYYKNILDSLENILPQLEENYTMQIKDSEYCIMALYLICQKKIIQQVISLKRKTINLYKEIKNKILQTKIVKIQTINNNKITQQKQKKYSNHLNHQKITEIPKIDNTSNVNSPLKKQKRIDDPNLPLVMRRATKVQLFTDFRQRIPIIFQHIYSCLDLGLPQILDFYVPTLRPQDNIDIIYRKQSQRNKKSRKQLKQFIAEYFMFIDRRAYLQKKRMLRHKALMKVKKSPQPIKPQKKVLPDKVRRISQTVSVSTQKLTHNIKPLGLIYPINSDGNKNQNQQRKKKIKSLFRERIQSSITNSKQTNNNIFDRNQKQNKKIDKREFKFISQSSKPNNYNPNKQNQSQGASPNNQTQPKSAFMEQSRKKSLKNSMKKRQQKQKQNQKQRQRSKSRSKGQGGILVLATINNNSGVANANFSPNLLRKKLKL